MKKIFCALIFIFSFHSLSAQYAVVVDEGGFVNVYDEEKEELDRLGSDGVIAIVEEDGDWVQVNYTKYEGYAASSGYIKKINLIDISSFTEIPIISQNEDSVVLGNDEFRIDLRVKKFIESENKLSYFSEENSDIITAINDEPYWGTKVGMPSTEYECITFRKDGETNKFPEQSFANLFNPHLSLTKAFYDHKRDVVYFYAQNGDISGAYTALWVVEFNEYAIHYIFD